MWLFQGVCISFTDGKVGVDLEEVSVSVFKRLDTPLYGGVTCLNRVM